MAVSRHAQARAVILTNPTPNIGAKLIKTVYRVEAQAKAVK